MDDFSSGQPIHVCYDSETETYRTQYTPDGPETMDITVVSAVASVTGESPLDMEPLYEEIGGPMFDMLLDVVEVENNDLSFRFEGTNVTVYSSGDIVIDPIE